jgi:hypothetical protein
MKTLTVKMPAFLASALVNGDVSGLTCRCPPLLRCATCSAPAAEPVHSFLCRTERVERAENEHGGNCDFRWLKVALDYCAPGRVVSTASQEYFSWSCGLPGWGYFGADMLDYVVMYKDEDVP